ncbi:MAG: response regulator transcription factor, partial [Cyclobacteriaceae bacterium]
MHKLALVEDDQSLGYILKEYLQLNEYEITWLKNAEDGYAAVTKSRFDLIIIDVNLPDYDGFELAEKLNESNSKTPFIFLTARRLKVDKLKGFKLGGEDFIVKPVDEEELLARIAVVLRRSTKPNERSEKVFRIGAIEFHTNTLQLGLEGRMTSLTEIEGDLLRMLCANQGQLVGKRDIMHKIWKEDNYFTRRSMDVFISRLRKLLSADPNVSIKTIHG